MNNKKLGDSFEIDFLEHLSKLGYWCTYLEGAAHTGAQPCDTIAGKNGRIWAVDCKTLNNENGLFPVDRIEENQRLAYKRFKKCGNENFFLAILWNNNVYFIPMFDALLADKSIDLKQKVATWRNFYED